MRAVAFMAGIMLAGAALAQPAPQRPAQPPAQTPAQRTAPAQAPAPAPIPTRVTAGTLTTLCGQDRGACLSYVLGSADAFAGALVAAGRPQAFCVPRGTTNDQVAQSVVRYLRAHPEEGRTNAALVVLAGLAAAFPCGY
jgi:hypothetical protein